MNPFESAPEIIETLDIGRISTSTVKRCLRKAGLYSRRPAKNPALNDRHVKERLKFAQKCDAYVNMLINYLLRLFIILFIYMLPFFSVPSEFTFSLVN